MLVSYNAGRINLFKKIFYITYFKECHLLHFIVKTYIIFKSSKTILQLYALEISVFANSLCIFAIVVIIVLNFSTSKVQKYLYYRNIYTFFV